jgi:NADP-dependent aldehyde dehydrogenase
VFSNLNSSGIEVGTALVKHPGVKAVGFTGSIGGGRALFNLAAQREEPIPVFAEMGSVNPVVVLPEALSKKGGEWAAAYAGSITLGSGQLCTNPGLLLGIKSKELENFVNQLSDEILKKEPSSMLHPNIAGTYEKNRQSVISQQGTTITAEYNGEVQTNFAKQAVLTVEGKTFLTNKTLHQEVFGPFSLVVECENAKELESIVSDLEGQLTGTVIGEEEELNSYREVIEALQSRVGRMIFNGVPTGVEVCAAMHHGGPYPSSTDSRFTAVGVHAIKRWVRPVSFQDWPDDALPDALKDENPLKISRWVDGTCTSGKIERRR